MTKLFASIAVIAALIFSPNIMSQNEGAKMSEPRLTPKVIIFDVNETLLDLEAMRSSVGDALGGRNDLLPYWFSKMLHYSLVDTLNGEYRDFAEVGAGALIMVAEEEGIELTFDEAKAAITGPITSLPPHSDVKPGLTALKSQGFKLVSLTNSSDAGVAKQFEYAELTAYFERRMSVQDVKAFKPAPITYNWALEELGVQPEEALMVAAHSWDLAGAKAQGLQTAFIARPGAKLYPNVSRPDYIVSSVTELSDVLRAQSNSASESE